MSHYRTSENLIY